MSNNESYVRLPAHLFPGQVTIIASDMHDDEHFAAHQAEFFRHLFGRCAYLRAQSRETPSADAFLSVFVSLMDLLIANAPSEAAHCMEQLHRVLALTFPQNGNGDEGTPSKRSPLDDSACIGSERASKSNGSVVQIKGAPRAAAAGDADQSGT